MIKKAPLILIIDDNKDFLEIFGAKLESAGYRIVKALGGDDGLLEAKKISPDLILLDVEMPKESGIKVLSRINNEFGRKSPRIVFLTNYGESENEHSIIDKKFAIDIGATDYIKKNDDLDAIVSQINDILAV